MWWTSKNEKKRKDILCERITEFSVYGDPRGFVLEYCDKITVFLFFLTRNTVPICTINIAILTKLIYRFKPILIRILAGLKNDQLIPKFIWKFKGPRISKAILIEKNKVAGVSLPSFDTYYKVTAIKIFWYWWKDRHIDQ